MHTFGASAPLKEVQRKFGFTPERVAEAAREVLTMKPTQAAARAGPEPVARQHHPRHARRRDQPALHRRALGHRADLQPDDLRQGDHAAATPTTSRSPSCASGAWSPRRSSSSWRWPTSRARPGCSSRIHERTDGVDGWVSLEVSPLLADDTKATIAQVADLHCRAEREHLHQDPRHARGPPAIEESIFAGIPINVTLLFSTEQYLARGRGVHARHRAPDRGGARPRRALGRLALHQPLGRRGRRRGAAGAARTARDRGRQGDLSRPIASCSTPSAGSGSPTRAPGRSACSSPAPAPRTPRPPTPSTSRRFAAPDTINTMPDKTLLAFADHGKVGDPLPADGGDAEEVFKAHQDAGIDTDALGAEAPEGGRGRLRQVLERAARDDQVRVGAPGGVEHAASAMNLAGWRGPACAPARWRDHVAVRFRSCPWRDV